MTDVAQRVSGPSTAGYHRIATFISCPRKFAYRWLLHLVQQVEPVATGRGTVLHEGLEEWYRTGDKQVAIDKMHNMPPRYAHCIPAGMLLFHRYLNRYPRESFKVLAAEHEISVRLGPHVLTRKLDLIYELERKLWVMDHKTAGRTADRLRTAEADWSLMTQELTGRSVLPHEFNLPYGGFVLNVVGTGDEPSFLRQPVIFSQRELAEAPASLFYFFERLQRLLDDGVSPWDFPRSGKCIGRYGVCDYRPLCRSGRAMLGMYEVEG